MADFPPNLDDGELWLPSDILPDEVVSAKISVPEFPSELTYMEELSQQLSTYALLERNQQADAKPTMNLTQNLEQIRPSSRFGSVAPQRRGLGLGFDVGRGAGHNLYASGYGSFRVGLRPIYQFAPAKPAHIQCLQVEGFVQARGCRSVQQQRQQNQGRHNCFLPFRGNGSVMGGFIRESGGGTGVFFPRVSATTEEKKKQSVRNGEEYRQRQPVKKGAVGKQEVGLHLPPEMGLPKDWTY